MYKLTSQLKDFNIHATDGEMGKIKDLYFSNQDWIIKYAIVDTRKWLPGRKVLLAPSSFTTFNENEKNVYVEYDKETIRNSPSVPEEEDLTVTQENNLIDYFGWNRYTDNALIHAERGPIGIFPDNQYVREKVPEEPQVQTDVSNSEGNNLHSEDETIDFKVHAKDGKIGKVVDMIFDTENWNIHYIVVQSNERIVEDEFYIYRTEQIETVDWFGEDLYISDSVQGLSGSNPFRNREHILTSL